MGWVFWLTMGFLKSRYEYVRDNFSERQLWLYKKLRCKSIRSDECIEILKDTELPDKCIFCGIDLQYISGFSMARNPASVDRVVPGMCGGEYTLGNIQIICSRCNRLKSGFLFADKEDMIKYVREV